MLGSVKTEKKFNYNYDGVGFKIDFNEGQEFISVENGSGKFLGIIKPDKRGYIYQIVKPEVHKGHFSKGINVNAAVALLCKEIIRESVAYSRKMQLNNMKNFVRELNYKIDTKIYRYD